MFLLSMISSIFISGDKEKEYKRQNRFCRFLLNSSAKEIAVFSRTKFHVSGNEKIPQDTPFLLVCNHRSKLDPIYTWLVLKKYNISFITKKENFSIPWFGKLIRKCCFPGIDRRNPVNAMHAVKMATDLLKRKEVNIGVYPEGTRHLDCVIGDFHPFVFRIAKDANAPIVVMSIRGTEEVRRKFPFGKPHVYMDILDVYSAEKVGSVPHAELCSRSYNLIKQHIAACERRNNTQT